MKARWTRPLLLVLSLALPTWPHSQAWAAPASEAEGAAAPSSSLAERPSPLQSPASMAQRYRIHLAALALTAGVASHMALFGGPLHKCARMAAVWAGVNVLFPAGSAESATCASLAVAFISDGGLSRYLVALGAGLGGSFLGSAFDHALFGPEVDDAATR